MEVAVCQTSCWQGCIGGLILPGLRMGVPLKAISRVRSFAVFYLGGGSIAVILERWDKKTVGQCGDTLGEASMVWKDDGVRSILCAISG
jgi:hypothetical protein